MIFTCIISILCYSKCTFVLFRPIFKVHVRRDFVITGRLIGGGIAQSIDFRCSTSELGKVKCREIISCFELSCSGSCAMGLPVPWATAVNRPSGSPPNCVVPSPMGAGSDLPGRRDISQQRLHGLHEHLDPGACLPGALALGRPMGRDLVWLRAPMWAQSTARVTVHIPLLVNKDSRGLNPGALLAESSAEILPYRGRASNFTPSK